MQHVHCMPLAGILNITVIMSFIGTLTQDGQKAAFYSVQAASCIQDSNMSGFIPTIISIMGPIFT